MGSDEERVCRQPFQGSSYGSGVIIINSNYKPAIVCGQTGLDRPFSSSPLIGRNSGGGPRNTRRHKTSVCHSLLSCCQVESSRSKALDLLLLATKGGLPYIYRGLSQWMQTVTSSLV